MSDVLMDQLRHRIAVLINMIRENAATRQDMDELEQIVLGSPEACRAYNDLVYLECDLKWTHERNSDSSSDPGEKEPVDLPDMVCDLSEIDPVSAWGIATPSEIFPPIQDGSGVPLLGFLTNCLKSGGGSIVWSVLILVMLLPVALFFFVMHNSTVEKLPVVAQVMRQTEGTRWEGRLVSLDGSNISLGQRLRCQDGTVELRMASGVFVLLEGNTSLFLTGPNTLYLERGSLVAKVPHDASGFAVQTSDADFIDIGTEFGVNVDPGQMSQTKVLDGQIVVQTEGEDGKKNQKQLSTNEAAQVASDGQIESIDPDSLAFNSIYPEDRVCLFNLICHTSGYYPDGLWIDPRNGEMKLTTESDWLLNKKGDSQEPQANEKGYHLASRLPVIDGIFLPASGEDVVVNSAGGRFGGIKNTEDNTHCCFAIGESKAVLNWNIPQGYGEILTGLSDSDNAMSSDNHVFMNLHANLGITFDLDAVRLHAGRKVVRFTTMARKGEDIVYEKPSVLDVLILADEKPIYKKRGITAQEGTIPISVDIPENARFLTIISADGGDGSDTHTAIVCDHLILDDPAFVLERKATREKSEE